MSFLEQLSAYGVTAEDLEKAASVRLFEKAAHSEGQYSTELRNPVDAPLNSTHPNMEINPMDYIDLFEKQAADEGIDLDMLDDYELAELYNHFISEVSDEDYDYDDYDDEYEKLAEAELLGEVMADAYLNKIAAENYSYNTMGQKKFTPSSPDTKEGKLSRLGRRIGNRAATIGRMTMSNKRQAELLNEYLQRSSGDKQKAIEMFRKSMRNRGLAAGGAVIGGSAALGAGAMALAKKRREKKAEDPQGFFSRKNFKDGVGKARYQQGLAGGSLREGVGRFLSSEKGTQSMQKKLIKKLFGEGKTFDSLTDAQKKLLNEKTIKAFKTRGAGALGLGAAAALGGAAYAGSRMSKKASLIEELALEKAASWSDDDWEYSEIDELSDELAFEILEDAGYFY